METKEKASRKRGHPIQRATGSRDYAGTSDENGQAQSINGHNGSNGSNGNGSKHSGTGIFLSKQTLDAVFKHKSRHADDMLAVLLFYHYTGLWQQTNRPKATVEYVAKGLHWDPDKVRAIRSLLTELELIKDVRVIDPRSRKVLGWFVELAFFHPRVFPECGFQGHKCFKVCYPNAFRSGRQSKTSLDSVFKTSLNTDTSLGRFAQQKRETELSRYTPDEREVIDAYNAIVCDHDRSWRRVNKYADSVCEVIEIFFTFRDEDDDTETFFRKVLAASRCGCGHKRCKHCGAVSIPRRDQSRTLVSVAWKNY
jgi:hypothetical protein